jgi:Zn-dependent peptidase ImmA (M78 family)/transcriptional regulator with XRE-family HTH domain
MMRVPVSPVLLRWARDRAGMDELDLAGRFPKLADWEEGTLHPTLRQLESFAGAVHVPVGYLFLAAPPDEALPIPDFRTLAGRPVRRPSPNLLDTIYACQERQGWYREFAQVTRQPELAYVGSATLQSPPEVVAQQMRATLGFDLDQRRDCPTWSDALRLFIQQADGAGVLVMVSGVVLSNNRRALDVGEFRGFALADRRAPLVFVNGADSKAAQMFTLAHELAHLWLGQSALSDLGAAPPTGHRREEIWCNKVAAELLVPLHLLTAELIADEALAQTLARLSRRFKVSTLVILRRLLDAGSIGRGAFEAAWAIELERLQSLVRPGVGGGDFYRTTLARVSRRFARAIVESTLEGQTLYRDAFRMLGVAKTETFNHLGREVGIVP